MAIALRLQTRESRKKLEQRDRRCYHERRRSYACLLINSGSAPEIIQELLGHADVRMTRRAYAVLLDKTLKKPVQKHLSSFDGESTNVAPLRGEKARR